MRIALLAVVGLLSTASLQARAELDKGTQEQLEGIWLMEDQPKPVPCVRNRSTNTQIEFEFRKTSGRLLLHEPFDVFAAVPIATGERTGDVVAFTFTGPGGIDTFRLRIGPDWLEFLPDSPPTSTSKGRQRAAFAYRCGAPDWSVTGSVPTAALELLTPARSPFGAGVGPIFVEPSPDASDAEACKWGWQKKPRWLMFEVFGPVHYYVFGQGFGSKFDLSPIRSIRQRGRGSLELEVIDGRHRTGDPWGPGARGRVDRLTIRPDGPTRIRIPELKVTFVRCKENGPVEVRTEGGEDSD